MPQCVAAPSDVRLKGLCPESLLCKKRFIIPMLLWGRLGALLGAEKTPAGRMALATPGHYQVPPASHTSLAGFCLQKRFGSCCQNLLALHVFPAAPSACPALRQQHPTRGPILQTTGTHCPWLWPTLLAPASPGALGKTGCEITPEKAQFYVSPAGSLVFLGQCFEATWSVTRSLRLPDGTTGCQVQHFRQKVGITLS